MELGLQISKIHYTVEFPEHRPCFQEFATKVSDARRRGDADPDTSILADTFKLVGNSAYGKITMNKARQTDTIYANGARATYLMNLKRFKMCRRIDDDLFENELYKKEHVFDLPLHLGVFVYGYAKLRMCEWTHKGRQVYLPRENYQLAEMDTDSSYFGLSAETLE